MPASREREAWTDADERRLVLLRRNVRDRMTGFAGPASLDAYLATFEDYVQRKALATPAPAAGTTLTVDGFVKFVEDCRWNSFPVSLREFKQLAQAYAALSRHDGAERTNDAL